MALGLCPQIEAEDKTWRFMGIQSKNRKEWVLTHCADIHQNIVTVAFYDTLGPDATKFVLEQTQLTTMAVSQDYVVKLSKMKIEDTKGEGKMSQLKNLIVFENGITEEMKNVASEADITLYTLEEVIFKGREAETKTFNEPKPDDCFGFSYTSGTTGDPKGVKLSHKMGIMSATAVNVRCGKLAMTEEDSYISYLPAAHSFEQCIFSMSCITGLKCGFFAGDVLKLTDDIGILKPTLFPSVPRLFNRIYGKILDGTKAATGIKGWLVNKAIAAKLANLRDGTGVTHAIYDKLVFKKMKAILGGEVKVMITGSAPISGEVLEFLKICFCAPITEGYGMTETMAGSCLTFPDDPQTGVVGGPLQNVKIRLRDIPEMGYLSSDSPPRGEVCFWGPSIMKGYFKNPEKTAEAFHNDWLLSGDVGMVFPNGNIKIIDRAKNIFKLSQGEYIAPEKLENVYIQCSYVLQCWIYGDSLRDFIVGFFVVDPAKVKKYCEETGKTQDEALMDDMEFKQAVYDELMALAGTNKLNGLEKPKHIVLLAEPFTVESEILTPTMKLKRNIAKKMFQDKIDAMYADTKLMAPSKK
jgi:long-chain acyl-CoA synthetase